MAAARRGSCLRAFRHFEDEQSPDEEPRAEDRENDRIPAGQAENVRPGVERIEQEPAHEPRDDPRSRRRDVAESHEEPGLTLWNHVLDESPINRKEQAVTDPNQDSDQGRL